MAQYIAFWRYDTYPYFLTGAISEFGIGENFNKVKIPAYGNAWVAPFAVLSMSEAENLIEAITEIEKEKRKEELDLRKKYYRRLKTALPGGFFDKLDIKEPTN